MAEFGFDRLIYGFTRFLSEKKIFDLQDAILLTNHDREYTDVFVGEQHYMDAPMVNWALYNEGVGSWGILAQMQADKTLTP
ncbi:MAG: autoinducer binding domain-containing protein, partial [Tateyamaria sp.]|nr:autoinducer binding domain-containing protein [Tateyamaria sp.]